MFMAVFHFYSLPYLHIWISSASTTSLLLKLHQQKEVMQFKYLSIPQEKKELFVRIQILGRGRGRGRADSGKEKLKKKNCPSYLLQLLKATTSPSPGNQEDTDR